MRAESLSPACIVVLWNFVHGLRNSGACRSEIHCQNLPKASKVASSYSSNTTCPQKFLWPVRGKSAASCLRASNPHLSTAPFIGTELLCTIQDRLQQKVQQKVQDGRSQARPLLLQGLDQLSSGRQGSTALHAESSHSDVRV